MKPFRFLFAALLAAALSQSAYAAEFIRGVPANEPGDAATLLAAIGLICLSAGGHRNETLRHPEP
ncbi:hypothetical protein [Massilia endophytica]|uniref:hypothetical protein n=1 Tax=Massilia endophytica TaxID=2899220 RepID=UPI001E4FFA1E|nr:hypothetical protein [Massilia endophytica]UGQ47512.1 hypothetical protein LSQ66_03245 [Massilia endophytica]